MPARAGRKRSFRQTSGEAVCLGPETEGCVGKWGHGGSFRCQHSPSALKGRTALLDCLGCGGTRDPDTNSICGGTEVGVASLLKADW